MHNNEKSRKLKKYLQLINRFLPFAFWVSVILGFGEIRFASITILSALLHELGHIAALYIIGKNSYTLHAVLSGFRIKTTEKLSYKEDLFLYASGPITNLLFALPFQFSGMGDPLFSSINLMTCISNILPIKGNDGYGIIKTTLEMNGKFSCINSVLEITSLLSVISFCFFALYFMARYGTGYWIYALFFYSLVQELSKIGENVKSEIL